MRVIKGILAGIGVLAALLCALIIMSAVNPSITETLSSLVTGNGLPKEKKEEIVPADSSDSDRYDWEEPESNSFGIEEDSWDDYEEDEGESSEDETNGTSDLTEDAEGYDSVSAESGDESERTRGANGYEAPSELDIKVPEAMSGKAGYQPITEKSEALPDAEGGEYTSTLGYGETGDGLFLMPIFTPITT